MTRFRAAPWLLLTLACPAAWAQDSGGKPKNFTPDFVASAVCNPDNPTEIVRQNVAQMLYWRAREAGLLTHFKGNIAADPQGFFAGTMEPGHVQCAATQPECDAELYQIRNSFAEYMRDIRNNGASKDKSIVGRPSTTSLQAFMADTAPSGLSCAPAHPKPAAASPPTLGASIVSGLQKLRLRGQADQMSANHAQASSTTPGADTTNSNQPYYANQGAKLSLGVDGTQHAQSDKVVGTIGVPVYLGWDEGSGPKTDGGPLTGLYWTPYVGFDREATFKKSSKASTKSFAANFFDFGFVLEKYFDALRGTIMVRPDYLSNFVDESRLLTGNFRYVPLTEIGPGYVLPFNHYRYTLDNQLGYMLRLDARANVGTYVATGKPADPRLNQDYVRLGGSVGPAVELAVIPDFPVEISAVYTGFAPVSGFSKDLGNFQASISVKIGPSKLAAIAASYINGRREDTGQRIDMTTIGLTLQY